MLDDWFNPIKWQGLLAITVVGGVLVVIIVCSTTGIWKRICRKIMEAIHMRKENKLLKEENILLKEKVKLLEEELIDKCKAIEIKYKALEIKNRALEIENVSLEKEVKHLIDRDKECESPYE